MTYFLDLVFLKLALCVLKMTDRKRLLQEELTFSVTKKKQNRKRRATDQAGFSTSVIISFPLSYFNVLLILFLKISSSFYNHRIK